MLQGGNLVFQFWTEWILGLVSGLLIKAFDCCWGVYQQIGNKAMFYSCCCKIIKDIKQCIKDGTVRDKRQAINQLEQLQGRRSLDWLYKNI